MDVQFNPFAEKGIHVVSQKVMYGERKVFGVHYTLDGDGCAVFEELTVDS